MAKECEEEREWGRVGCMKRQGISQTHPSSLLGGGGPYGQLHLMLLAAEAKGWADRQKAPDVESDQHNSADFLPPSYPKANQSKQDAHIND